MIQQAVHNQLPYFHQMQCMQVLPRRLFAMIKDAVHTQRALAALNALGANEGSVQGRTNPLAVSSLAVQATAGTVAMGKLSATVASFSG